MSEKKTRGPRPIEAGVYYKIDVRKPKDQKPGQARFRFSLGALSEVSHWTQNDLERRAAECMHREISQWEADAKMSGLEHIEALEKLGWIKGPTGILAPPKADADRALEEKHAEQESREEDDDDNTE